TNSLAELAAKLCANGPVKQELARRRVRGLLAGVWLFDTLEAHYVWEHPYFPFFYIPVEAIESAPGVKWEVRPGEDHEEGFVIADIIPDTQLESLDAVLFTKGPLKGLVKVLHSSLDSWYVEDEKLLGIHPKDPYRRVDCYHSSREVRIEVDGRLVAKSTDNVFLYETGLRARYYLSPSAVLSKSKLVVKAPGRTFTPSLVTDNHPLLLHSDTLTVCPYKGEARYYHLSIGDKIIEDAVWYYTCSIEAQIQNRLCFYNEKVDIFVDGVKEER
ncbi:hypothetical protein B0T14DRAFT_419786, partial [Immersiella caudata]